MPNGPETAQASASAKMKAHYAAKKSGGAAGGNQAVANFGAGVAAAGRGAALLASARRATVKAGGEAGGKYVEHLAKSRLTPGAQLSALQHGLVESRKGAAPAASRKVAQAYGSQKASLIGSTRMLGPKRYVGQVSGLRRSRATTEAGQRRHAAFARSIRRMEKAGQITAAR